MAKNPSATLKDATSISRSSASGANEHSTDGAGGTTLRAMTLTSEPVWRQRQEPSLCSAHTSSGRSLAS